MAIYSDSADSNRLKMKDESGSVRLLETEWSAVPSTVLPTSDNGLDLGSAAKSWRTLYIDTSIVLGAAASKIVPGATSFAIRNNADNANNLIITDAGAMTVRTSLTVTTSATITTDLTVDTSTLKVDSANDCVGIGTASPLALLHLTEDTSGAAQVRLTNSSNGSNLKNWQLVTQSGGRLDLQSVNDAWDTVSATGLSIAHATGYVGMGTTSPVGKLHVYDTDGGTFFFRTSALGDTQVAVVSGVVRMITVRGVWTDSTGTSYAFDNSCAVNSSVALHENQSTKCVLIEISSGGDVTIRRSPSQAVTYSVAMEVIYR